MIIDTHVCILPPEAVRDRRGLVEGESFFSGCPEDLLAAVNDGAVGECWLCGVGFEDMGLCREVNDYILEVCAGAEGRIRPLCVVPPLDPGAELEILRCAEKGAIGVGELFPDGQGWNIGDVRETWRLAATCHEASLFVLINSLDPLARLHSTKPAAGKREFWSLARNHPELKIIFSNLGDGLFMYEGLPAIALDLQNVFYDTSCLPFGFDGDILKFAMTTAPQKLLYGSGLPMCRYSEHRKIIEKTLDEDEVLALVYENAKKFIEA